MKELIFIERDKKQLRCCYFKSTYLLSFCDNSTGDITIKTLIKNKRLVEMKEYTKMWNEWYDYLRSLNLSKKNCLAVLLRLWKEMDYRRAFGYAHLSVSAKEQLEEFARQKKIL